MNTTSSIQILIAEDHELTRGGLVYALNKKKPHINIVAEAEDGEQAIALAKQHQPDMILMDIGMPVMDGIQATKTIKQSMPEIKVIVLTSHRDENEILGAIGAGADAYSLKDIKTDRLIQVIDMVMEGALWLDPSIAKVVMNHLTKPSVTADPKPLENRETYKTDLTDREMDVLALIVEGKTNKDIADELVITIHTVKSHVASILQKLSVDDRTQLAIKALREGLVQPKTR